MKIISSIVTDNPSMNLFSHPDKVYLIIESRLIPTFF